MNKLQAALPIVVIASILIFTAQAQSSRNPSLTPAPARRANTLKLKAKGLLPNTTFAVFLGADYIGAIATNADGRGSMQARTLVDGDSLRQNLNLDVLRFASAAAAASEDICFAPVQGEVTGTAMLGKNASATTTWITGPQSINDDGSIFHTINWRFNKCVFTF